MTDQNIDPTAGARPRGYGQGTDQPGSGSVFQDLGTEPTATDGVIVVEETYAVPVTTGTTGAGGTTGSGSTVDATGKATQVASDAAGQAAQVKDTAMTKAADVKDTAVERGSDVVEVAKDELAHLADEARGHVQRLWSQTSDQVREQADNGRRQLADLLHSLSSELGDMASRSTQDGPVTALAKQAAARGGELSHWLSNTEPTDMLTEVRRFARRRPWVFLGGAALAGVLVGRLGRGLAGGSQDEVGSRGTAGSAASGSYTGGTHGIGSSYGAGSTYGTTAGTDSTSGTGAPDGAGSAPGTGAPYGAGSASGTGSTAHGGQPSRTTGDSPYGSGISGDLPDGELR